MKLIIENLSKSFDDKEVIKDASYEFEKGTVYALSEEMGQGRLHFLGLLQKLSRKMRVRFT